MTKKNNQNNKSGQLARKSQNNNQGNQNQNQLRGTKVPKNVGMDRQLGTPVFGAPVAYSSPTMNRKPVVQASKTCTRVLHRELVATVNGVTTFGSTAYALNPGLVASFPWLASIAGSFEQYSFKKLRFHYVTRCATTYVGSVLLAPEYDALDAAPTTEVNMAMMTGAVEDVPWRDQIVNFVPQDMFPLGPRKFIRTGAIASSADLKTYDAGQLFVALASCADTSGIGKLWVEYDVELYIPQNPNSIQAVGVGAAAIFSQHTPETFTSTVAKLVSFDTSLYNTIGAINTGGSFLLPSGDYLIHASIDVDDTNAETFQVLIEMRKNGSSMSPAIQSAFIPRTAATGAPYYTLSIIGYMNSTGVDAVSIYATLTGAAGTLATAADSCQISIQRVA